MAREIETSINLFGNRVILAVITISILSTYAHALIDNQYIICGRDSMAEEKFKGRLVEEYAESNYLATRPFFLQRYIQYTPGFGLVLYL